MSEDDSERGGPGTIPATIEDKMDFGETIQTAEVYRDGPRFWVARVTDGEGREFVVKDTVAHAEKPDPNNLHSPEVHIQVEIDMVTFLNQKLQGDDKITADMLLASNDRQPWYVTEYLGAENWLGTHQSPFFYNLEVLARTDPQAVFNSIRSLQSFTDDSDVPELITRDTRAQTNVIWEEGSDRAFLSEHTGVARELVDQAYIRALDIRRAMPRVLTHGEVYPQHIFVTEDAKTAQFIDWENAKLGDSLSDHAAVWLRAYENPEWQAAYYKLVSEQDGFNVDEWNANVLFTAMGNYWYLSMPDWDKMDADRKAEGADFCGRAALQVVDALTTSPN